MAILNKFLLQQTILFAFMHGSLCKPMWSYEITNISFENLTPDVATLIANRTIISRGIYALCAIIEIKEDIDADNVIIENELYTSRTGSKDSYVKTPLYNNQLTLTEFGKKIYRPYLKESLDECCDNPWKLVNGELEPLKIRVMTFTNCVVSTDKMPSYVPPGFYRLVTYFKNQIEGKITYDVIITID